MMEWKMATSADQARKQLKAWARRPNAQPDFLTVQSEIDVLLDIVRTVDPESVAAYDKIRAARGVYS